MSETGGDEMSEAKQNEIYSSPNSGNIKLILLGDSSVGKTQLVERFLMDGYNPEKMSTFALTLFRHEAEIDGQKVNVDLWDTAGQERYDSMHPSYYFRAHVCLLVFDVTRSESYFSLGNWYNELREYRPGVPVIVLANKIDANPEMTRRKFNFAHKRGLDLVFVSASDGTNVVEAFDKAIRAALEYKQNPDDEFYEEVMDLLSEMGQEKSQEGEKSEGTTEEDKQDTQ